MKRFFILTFLMSLISINLTAQEIRGVETKVSIYEGKDRDGNACYWAAFEFINKNSIPVSVDAELFRSKPEGENYGIKASSALDKHYFDKSHTYPRLISAKSFVLQPGESYLWKHETEQYYCAAIAMYLHAFKANKESWSDEQNYFVKYKSYKLE